MSRIESKSDSTRHPAVQKRWRTATRRLNGLPKPLDQLSGDQLERKRCISRVLTGVLHHLTGEFVDMGFEWILPVVFSKSTDPLWPDPGESLRRRIQVEVYGEMVRTTLSMIVHKMVACSLASPKLFTLSPNVRVERIERVHTGKHAYEFTQLDFEVRNATSKQIRSQVEQLIYGLILSLKKDAQQELTYLGRYHDLRVPDQPFKVYDQDDLENDYGADWETKLTHEIHDPVWITNIPREFYDFQDLEDGRWDNYDLLLPKYGEVLSGSRREWEHHKIATKMERDDIQKGEYELLLKLAAEGRIKPSAGAGIGIERLVSWIVGAKHIGEAQPFPKIPGVVYDL